MNLKLLTFAGPRQEFLGAICKGQKVLHLGCTSSPDTVGRIQRGQSLHMKLLSVAREIHGIDLDANALRIMREQFKVPHLHLGNVEDLQAVDLDVPGGFDVVVAAEIIEHLSCPGKMLEGIKRFMSPRSRLFLTTPNPLSLKFFLHALRGNEVQGPDHTVLLSPQTGTLLLEGRHGYELDRIYGCLETHPSSWNRLTRPLFSTLFRLMPWYADGLIFAARLPRHDSL